MGSIMSSSSSNSRTSIRTPNRSNTAIERGVYCRCGIQACCWEAWKEGTLDPGRRFFGCSRYKDPELNCSFFQWAEPHFTERAREVIGNLQVKLGVKASEIQNLSDELRFAERKVVVLNEEFVAAKEKNKKTEEMLLKKDKQIYRLKLVLLIVVTFLLIRSC